MDLGNSRDPRVVRLLIYAMRRDSQVRFGAARALTEIGKPAVAPLIGLLAENDEEVCLEAVASLGKIRDPTATDALIRLLRHGTAKVRVQAAKALGELGDIRARESLVSALQDDCRLLAEASADALAQFGRLCLDPFIAVLRSGKAPDAVRHRIVEALGQVSDAKSVDVLTSALSDANVDIRKSATRALANIGGSHAVPPLLSALRDWQTRYIAAEALAKIGDRTAIPALVAVLRRDEPQVQKALLSFGSAAVDVLLQALAARDNTTQLDRTALMKTLGEIGDKRASGELMAALSSSDARERQSAAEALSKISWEPANANQRALYAVASCQYQKATLEGIAAVGPLLAVLREGYADFVQIAFALGEIGDSRATEPLITALLSKIPLVRRTAADALGKTGDMVAVTALLESVKDADESVCEAATLALRNLAATHSLADLETRVMAKRQERELQRRKVRESVGGKNCEQCARALQWWSRRVFATSGIRMDAVFVAAGSPRRWPDSGDMRPDNFAGACKECRDGFCTLHAPDGHCPLCRAMLTTGTG